MFRRDRFLYLFLLFSHSYLMPAQAIPWMIEMIKPAFTAVATALIAKGYTSYTGLDQSDRFSVGYTTGGRYKADIPPSLRDTTAHKNVSSPSTNKGPISYDVAPTREDYSANGFLDVEAYDRHVMEYSRRKEKEEKARKSDLEAIKTAKKLRTIIDKCKTDYVKAVDDREKEITEYKREKILLKVKNAKERWEIKEQYYEEMAVIHANHINEIKAIGVPLEEIEKLATPFNESLEQRKKAREMIARCDEYITTGSYTKPGLSAEIKAHISESRSPLIFQSTENNNEKPSDKPDYDPSKDPTKFRKQKKSDERAPEQRTDPRSAGKNLKLPDPDKPAQVNHIFAPRDGHIAELTPGAEEVLNTAYKMGTYLGEDATGNFHYTWTNPADNNQIWLKVRDCGKLHDGGANTRHWGLSKNGFLEKPFAISKDLQKGVTYAVAGVLMNAAYEGSGLKAKSDSYFSVETPKEIQEIMDKQREGIAQVQKIQDNHLREVIDQIKKDNLSDPEKAAKLMKDKMTGPSFDVKTKEQLPLKNVAIKMAQRKLNPEPSLSDMLRNLKPEPSVPTPTRESRSSRRSRSSDDDDSSSSSSSSSRSSGRWHGSRQNWFKDSGGSDDYDSSSMPTPPSPGPGGAPR